MNSYEAPTFDIIIVNTADVILTSGMGNESEEPGVGLPEVIFPRITT